MTMLKKYVKISWKCVNDLFVLCIDRFSKDQTSSNNRAKSSVYKKTVRAILESYPMCEDLIEDIFPKKGVMNLATCKTLIIIMLFCTSLHRLI